MNSIPYLKSQGWQPQPERFNGLLFLHKDERIMLYNSHTSEVVLSFRDYCQRQTEHSEAQGGSGANPHGTLDNASDSYQQKGLNPENETLSTKQASADTYSRESDWTKLQRLLGELAK